MMDMVKIKANKLLVVVGLEKEAVDALISRKLSLG
jgi:hypothetical protein